MKYLDNLYVQKEVFILASKKQSTSALPFFGKKTLKLRSHLVNSVNRAICFSKLNVVFRSQRRLKVPSCKLKKALINDRLRVLKVP